MTMINIGESSIVFIILRRLILIDIVLLERRILLEANLKLHPFCGMGLMGYNVEVGKNCSICQRVTMGCGRKIVIDDNVMIGSNCVVIEDIPDNATVVLQKLRIIIKDK